MFSRMEALSAGEVGVMHDRCDVDAEDLAYPVELVEREHSHPAERARYLRLRHVRAAGQFRLGHQHLVRDRCHDDADRTREAPIHWGNVPRSSTGFAAVLRTIHLRIAW